jgi:hypothetical protein
MKRLAGLAVMGQTISPMTSSHPPNDPSTGERNPVERIESVVDGVLGPDAGRIDVSVEHNVVFLDGSGIPPEALARAEAAVRSLPGCGRHRRRTVGHTLNRATEHPGTWLAV